jgi:hypothetical protein
MKEISLSPLDLMAAALKLEAKSRAEVAHRLLESLEELTRSENESLWLAEAERRDQAIDRGELESIPAETVFAKIRSRLK